MHPIQNSQTCLNIELPQDTPSDEQPASSNYEWSVSPIEKLSSEMLLNIFNLLEPDQHQNMNLVCHSWHTSVLELNVWETRRHLNPMIKELLSVQEKIIDTKKDRSDLVSLLNAFIAEIGLNLKSKETAQQIHCLCMQSSHAMYFQQELTAHVFAQSSYDELSLFEMLISNTTLSPNSFLKIAQAELLIFKANLMFQIPSNDKTLIYQLFAQGIEKLCFGGYLERVISLISHLEPIDDKISLLPLLLKCQLNPHRVSSILQLIIDEILPFYSLLSTAPLLVEALIGQCLFMIQTSEQISERHLDAFLTICEKIKSPARSANILGMLSYRKTAESIKLPSLLTSVQIDKAIVLILRAANIGVYYRSSFEVICASCLNPFQIDIVLSLVQTLGVTEDRYQCLYVFGSTHLVQKRLTEQQFKDFIKIVETLEPELQRKLSLELNLPTDDLLKRRRDGDDDSLDGNPKRQKTG